MQRYLNIASAKETFFLDAYNFWLSYLAWPFTIVSLAINFRVSKLISSRLKAWKVEIKTSRWFGRNELWSINQSQTERIKYLCCYIDVKFQPVRSYDAHSLDCHSALCLFNSLRLPLTEQFKLINKKMSNVRCSLSESLNLSFVSTVSRPIPFDYIGCEAPSWRKLCVFVVSRYVVIVFTSNAIRLTHAVKVILLFFFFHIAHLVYLNIFVVGKSICNVNIQKRRIVFYDTIVGSLSIVYSLNIEALQLHNPFWWHRKFLLHLSRRSL